MVGAALWASTGRGDDWVDGTRSPPDAERADPEEAGLDKVGTEVIVRLEKVTDNRTAEHLLSLDRKYHAVQLRNILRLICPSTISSRISPRAYLQRFSRNQKKA